jgi:hypothetical protein
MTEKMFLLDKKHCLDISSAVSLKIAENFKEAYYWANLGSEF